MNTTDKIIRRFQLETKDYTPADIPALYFSRGWTGPMSDAADFDTWAYDNLPG